MLKQRLLTAFILAPLVIWAFLALSAEHFRWLFLGVSAWMAWEFSALSGVKSFAARGLYTGLMPLLVALFWYGPAQELVGSVLWLASVFWVLVLVSFADVRLREGLWRPVIFSLLAGLWVIVPMVLAFDLLREKGLEWLFYGLFLVWIADSAAYFAGRRFGQRKLAPQISPGKTWEGVLGALLVVVVFSLVAHQALNAPMNVLFFVLMSVLIAAISVLGDLFESLLKRLRSMKDSGSLLPGHGGIMDRMDGFTAALPVMALWLL
jgi:phosphatidate cytidylyltransferase